MKIGDKIELKIKEPQKSETEQTFNDILSALKTNKLSQKEKIKWCSTILEILEIWYKEDELKSVRTAKTKLIPILHNLIEKGSIENMALFFDYYKSVYCFCARRDFECFVDYIEWNQPKKVLANRREVLRPYVDALNRIAFDDSLQYIITSYSPSMGKCVEENTTVFTPRGNVPIKQLNVGDEVYSEKNGEICVEHITNKWNTTKKQIKISLNSGKTLIISPEHKMLTLDGYKKASELTCDDYFYSLYSKFDGTERIDDNELLFTTCMIFEGHCKKHGMSYTGEYNEITREFLNTCNNLKIPYKKDTKSNNSASTYRLLQGDNSNNIKILKKYGIFEHLCYTKRLPQCFFNMPLEQKYKFIGIMIATDGCITSGGVEITLANENLIDDIQMLLNSCRIYCKKTKRYNKRFNSYSWRLNIPKDYVLKFKDKVYVYHKQSNYLKLKDNMFLKRGNISVKYPNKIFENLPPTGERKGYNHNLHVERKNDKSETLFEMYVKEYPELGKYRYKNFYWEKITNIEKIDNEVNMVDIEVSNTHNFIANGYVSHNSYLATLFSAWAYGLSINNSILRLSYSDELVLGFSRTIKGLLCSPEFAEVFPLFKLYNGKPFEVERESDWKIKNAIVPKSNHIARTRSGSTTGERASFAIIFDDMTKGAEEANSEKTHRDIYDKWNTEWWNRRDGQNCKFIFVGTQWCPEDILNRIIEDRNKISKLLPTDNEFVMESEDHSTIVIRVPMLDKNGKTTCSEVYPQEIAEQIKDTTDPFLFSCVYQQEPLPVTGREFDWGNLKQYEVLPGDLEKYCMASLDTARKGKDNVAMPIFKPDGKGNYYMVDCIFKQKPMDDLYDEIIEKIIENKIIKLVIENNIDTSLKTLLTEKLFNRGIFWCEIIEKYNTIKKEERIKNNRGIVQKFIIFKDKSLVKPNDDYGRLMDNLTKYSFDYPSKHDDAPDAVCMFASEIIVDRFSMNKPIAITRPF